MQRVINHAETVVEDLLTGFVATHPDLVRVSERNPRVIVSTSVTAGRVGLVTGGGSGHEPAFIGYLGPGMVDAVAVGEVFTSPSAQMFLDAFREADQGLGVACLYGNYAGDNLNVKMAVKMAAAEGIRVQAVAANDDVWSAPRESGGARRGVAGEILMWKCAAAEAAAGGSLESVTSAARSALTATRSAGIGLTSCTIPAVGTPNFTIVPGTMEVGIGHHGEPGVAVEPLRTAAEMADRLLEAILDEWEEMGDGDRAVALVSGLGATPLMELYILAGEVRRILAERGIRVRSCLVGNYFTSLEMMGVTVTLTRLSREIDSWLDVPSTCAAMQQVSW